LKLMRRRLLTLGVGLGFGLVAWAAAWALDQWRFLTELRQAEHDLDSRQFDAARTRLARLSPQWPGRIEVERIEVRWPSGRVERIENLLADTGYLIREGDQRPRPLAGFRAIPARSPGPP
jgi:hypothetical protein